MAKRRVFYSFHYKKDVMRASIIRNIGVIEGNSIVSDNDWEKVKIGGDTAIERWIDDNMNGCSCLVVLIGEDTAKRKWVKYEIEKAWNDGKGVVGIYIHNIIRYDASGYCHQGNNPFDNSFFNRKRLSSYIQCFNPKDDDAYNDIANNLERLVEKAITNRQKSHCS
ncbi:MAG: TIR domain-containing protein [Fusobacteriaceae bacterium]|jgi:hypothetical protein|nr:TIR domain-containing protein [Fusobacteriaceae bacterium]